MLTQLNFADLPIKRNESLLQQLPQHGWLCLFLDVDNGASGELVALQFDGAADALLRHHLKPAEGAETWTHCHAVTIYPADHRLCLPNKDAIDSPLPRKSPPHVQNAYDAVQMEIDRLTQTRNDVTLLGSPTLLNPDPRHSFEEPNDWMLLLQFEGTCPWLAGVSYPRDRYFSEPSFGSADYVQYFVRKSDYRAGSLALGRIGYMLT